jgi:hypothetical protein
MSGSVKVGGFAHDFAADTCAGSVCAVAQAASGIVDPAEDHLDRHPAKWMMQMWEQRPWRGYVLLAAIAAALMCHDRALSQEPFLLINEIFFDPGGNGLEGRDEYVELRGTPGMSLANHFLILIENENDILSLGNSGQIDHIFDLNYTAQPLGTSGFMTFRQKGSLYPVNAGDGGLHLINSGSGAGWGNNHQTAGSSSVGSSDSLGGLNPEGGVMENGGFTAMLIRNDSDGGMHAPIIDFDLDVGEDGLDFLDFSGPQWVIDNQMTGMKWTILDSIGFTEPGEGFTARYYGKINFGSEAPTPELPPEDDNYFNPDDHIEVAAGAVYELVDYEIEYLARWGNSTGQTADDWHISNFTDRVQSGSAGVLAPGGPDWRQSGEPHPPFDGNPNTPPAQPAKVETNQGVPYGTQLSRDIGRPNFLTGDYNKDGYANAADYTAWRNSLGQTGSDAADLPADGNHDYLISLADYDIWKDRYGQPLSAGAGGGSGSAATAVVPEPSSALLAVVSLCGLLLRRRR